MGYISWYFTIYYFKAVFLLLSILCVTFWLLVAGHFLMLVCVEVLQPSQPFRVMSSAVSLPYHALFQEMLSFLSS